MTTVCVVVSDRPHDLYLKWCWESLRDHLEITARWPPHIVDDTEHKLGMAGAVQAGFEWALSTGADHTMWVEEDFIFEQAIPVRLMAKILDDNPHLAQVVLKRQPWSAEEIKAGGIIEANPSAYIQMCQPVYEIRSGEVTGLEWVEHEQIFSLNPTLIPRRTLELGWPSGPLGVGNESGMTRRCLDAGMRFAFYGHRDDPPRCTHVGCERAAGWRL